MKTLLLCFSIALGMAPASMAQNASILGRVMDGPEPANGATVIVKMQGIPIQGCDANEAGEFRFENLNIGDYQLIVSYDAYRDTVPVLRVSANETRDLGVITLTSEYSMEGIIDSFVTPLIDLRGEPSGSFYNREQIRNNPLRWMITFQ